MVIFMILLYLYNFYWEFLVMWGVVCGMLGVDVLGSELDKMIVLY